MWLLLYLVLVLMMMCFSHWCVDERVMTADADMCIGVVTA